MKTHKITDRHAHPESLPGVRTQSRASRPDRVAMDKDGCDRCGGQARFLPVVRGERLCPSCAISKAGLDRE